MLRRRIDVNGLKPDVFRLGMMLKLYACMWLRISYTHSECVSYDTRTY